MLFVIFLLAISSNIDLKEKYICLNNFYCLFIILYIITSIIYIGTRMSTSVSYQFIRTY